MILKNGIRDFSKIVQFPDLAKKENRRSRVGGASHKMPIVKAIKIFAGPSDVWKMTSDNASFSLWIFPQPPDSSLPSPSPALTP